jgi:hypothetical protein
MAKFEKGRSGNPGGRPRGKTLADKLRKAAEPRFEAIVSAICDKAADGDVQAASLLFSRLVPPLRPVAEPVEFTGGDLIEQALNVIDALGAGDMTPDEAKAAISAIHEAAKVRDTCETSRQIELLTLQIQNQNMRKSP